MCPKLGPQLFSYFQQGIQNEIDRRNDGDDLRKATYVDFFLRFCVPKRPAATRGAKKIKHDIFLILSTDGVDPFKSSKYSYYPVVVYIANLPPWSRSKMAKVLPVMIIPGPNSPVSVTSFLDPLVAELESLSSDGMEVEMWDGITGNVRVHLLFALGDLPAIAKLCHLRGHNALFPCRFCLIQGLTKGNHCYYPNRIAEEHGTGNIEGKTRLRTVWNIDQLPVRSENYTIQV